MKPRTLFIALSISLGFAMAQAKSDEGTSDSGDKATYLLVGCYAKADEEAVKIYRFDGQNANTEYVCGAKGIPNPAFLTSSQNGERIYAIGDEDWKLSTANALHFNKKRGELSLRSSQPTGGGLPIYITLSPKEDFVLTATAYSYSNGTRRQAC